MLMYKALDHKGLDAPKDTQWCLPNEKGVKWMPAVSDEFISASFGWEVHTPISLATHLDDVIWEVEVDDEIRVDPETSGLYSRRCRLLRQLEEWNEVTRANFCADCARRIVGLATNPEFAEATIDREMIMWKRDGEDTYSQPPFISLEDALDSVFDIPDDAPESELAMPWADVSISAAWRSHARWAATAALYSIWASGGDRDAETNYQASRLAHYVPEIANAPAAPH